MVSAVMDALAEGERPAHWRIILCLYVDRIFPGRSRTCR